MATVIVEESILVVDCCLHYLLIGLSRVINCSLFQEMLQPFLMWLSAVVDDKIFYQNLSLFE